MNCIKHFITITNHKRLVMKGCFKLGLYKQGLLHDLSKYSPVEFIPSCRFYQGGKRSPITAQRADVGYSDVWLHHKGRNKHHFEYWVDNNSTYPNGIVAVEMPAKYLVEMFVDRVSASKNYLKERYTDEHPLEYFMAGKDSYFMNENTKLLLEKLLRMLKEKGEEETYKYIKKEVLKK